MVGWKLRLSPRPFFCTTHNKGGGFGVKKDAKKNDFLVKNFAFFGNVY